jgi:hypothetical protein
MDHPMMKQYFESRERARDAERAAFFENSKGSYIVEQQRAGSSNWEKTDESSNMFREMQEKRVRMLRLKSLLPFSKTYGVKYRVRSVSYAELTEMSLEDWGHYRCKETGLVKPKFPNARHGYSIGYEQKMLAGLSDEENPYSTLYASQISES